MRELHLHSLKRELLIFIKWIQKDLSGERGVYNGDNVKKNSKFFPIAPKSKQTGE